ncbi:MAG: ribosome silencing factor [Flavobacteriales bacterium]|nr:ribosome silencing factor [Flavobacteriales bacterium]MCB9192688.1 ribosome silencing factor [Flavobacteriales bacterium]MCB9205213.1 ribosome silencing factor [Flavobacteriales bacterium]
MKKKSREANTEQLVQEIINGLREKKGKDIVTLDLRKIDTSVTDFFVLCTGDSNTHVNALAGSVEEEVRKAIKDKPWHIEGTTNGEWVLLDYVNVVVHIFQRETREHYNIEGLWADADMKEYDDVAPTTEKK